MRSFRKKARPVVDPQGLDALGLIDFQINPHYLKFSPPGFRGETRDQRIAEFTLFNPDVPCSACRGETTCAYPAVR